MERINLLFLIIVGRSTLAIRCRHSLLWLLMLLGIGLIIGCGDEIEDLSNQTLVIQKVTPSQPTMNTKEVITVIAEAYYSGDMEDLSHRWMAGEGKIHDSGMISNDAETESLLCFKATYLPAEKKDTATYIDKITLEVYNGGKTVSSGISVCVVAPTTTPQTVSDPKTTPTGGGEEEDGD